MREAHNDHAFNDGLRFLQGATLNEEWRSLLIRLRRFAAVLDATSIASEKATGFIRLRCSPTELSHVDSTLMKCLTIEPLHRREQGSEVFVTVRFRRWWRRSVPFLMDPDGSTYHYRYERLDSDGPEEDKD